MSPEGMYTVQNIRGFVGAGSNLRRGRRAVSRTVILLGLTSMFTDVSSEMVATVLPLYLVLTIGFTPLQFGVIDGYQRGAAAMVSLGSGLFSDRRRRHKEVATAGYGLSAICKPLYVAVGGSFAWLGAVVFTDRVGKGIRTAPRDALISLSTPRESLGIAFGVHRALDTVGAMLGPLLAFGILALAPNDFNSIFIVSFCIALIGVGIIMLAVQGERETVPTSEASITWADLTALVREPRFRSLLLAAGVLNLVTISDGFLYLGLQRQMDLDTTLFPLMYTVTAFVFMIMAVPMGWLADRFGRGRMLLAGYALLLLLYSSLLLPGGGSLALIGYLIAFGAFYSATDGVLAALGASALPRGTQATGLALLLTITSLMRFGGSVLFGLIWTTMGFGAAVRISAIGLVIGLVIGATLLRHGRRSAEAAA